MSRCFPYPPPGYAKNGIRGEALIESIKLQRVGEKAKKERKKEKKREKKEKEKARENGEVESKKHGHKKRHRDERSQEDQRGGDCQKSRGNVTENLEKSSLTQEHGHPVGSQNSSDSTLNSNKRQRQSSPPDGSHNSGSIIRIRLPFQRHKDLEVLPSKEQPCLALGRNGDASIQWMHEPDPVSGRGQGEHPCSTSRNTSQELTLKFSKEKPCSSSGASEIFAHQEKSTLPSNLCGSCSLPLALKFRDLVENWIPPQTQSVDTHLDNQNWLFETKQKQKQNCVAKRCDVGSVGWSHGNSTAWPCTSYLSEVDIYALPFTIPF